jgi:DNA anti-recombination protein RmuC
MTELNATARVQFNTLKIICAEALADLADRLKEAIAEKDETLKRAIIDQIQALNGKVLEIRRAEIAYLNSTLADDQALRKLQGAIRSADAGLKKMQKLQTVLEGATKLLGVLTKLSKQFG